MTDRLYDVLSTALHLACKMIRENPPTDIAPFLEDEEFMACLCSPEDTEGNKYYSYFLMKALIKNLSA